MIIVHIKSQIKKSHDQLLVEMRLNINNQLAWDFTALKKMDTCNYKKSDFIHSSDVRIRARWLSINYEEFEKENWAREWKSENSEAFNACVKTPQLL